MALGRDYYKILSSFLLKHDFSQDQISLKEILFPETGYYLINICV